MLRYLLVSGNLDLLRLRRVLVDIHNEMGRGRRAIVDCLVGFGREQHLQGLIVGLLLMLGLGWGTLLLVT